MSPYRGISLATFFGCAPALDPHRSKSSIWYYIFKNQVTPKVLFDFICNPISHHNGVADYAPYGLRKVEAALLRDGFKREEIVVAHPDHVDKFIGPEKMMHKVVQIATQKMIPVEASIERMMKCGMGICGSCCFGDVLACKDGTVFDGQFLLTNKEFGHTHRNKSGILENY